MEKTATSIASLIIVLGVFCLTSCSKLPGVCLCEEGLAKLPKSLSQIEREPKIYFDCKQKTNCSLKLLETMQEKAIKSEHKKDYVCSFYNLANSSNTHFADKIFGEILPELFLKNPQDSLACLDLNKNDHMLLASSLNAYISEDPAKQAELNTLVKSLESPADLNADQKQVFEALKSAMGTSLTVNK